MLEEGAVLRRLFLTGICALGFACVNVGFASAADLSSANDVSAIIASLPTQTAPEGGEISADALAAAKHRLSALEPAAPTAGADLAMWSSDDSASAVSGNSSPVKRFANGIIARSANLAVALTRNAMRFLGDPYAFGGTSSRGFDCSGFVQTVFAKLGVHLPRTADEQYAAGHRVTGGIKTGDLVFFQTYTYGPSHVGIYLGHDRFIHSSSSNGVVVSSLHDGYWSARYLGAKRVSD